MKRLLGVLLVASFLLVMIAPHSVDAKGKLSKSEQIKKYNGVIAKFDKRIRDNSMKVEWYSDDDEESLKECCTYYNYVDVDKDGTYELLLLFSSPYGKMTTSTISCYGDIFNIYTLDKNGKPKRLLGDNDQFYYWGGNNGCYRLYKGSPYLEYYPGTDASPRCYRLMKNGKFSKNCTDMANWENAYTGKMEYYKNDKKISKKTYDKYMKKFVPTKKGYSLKKWKGGK